MRVSAAFRAAATLSTAFTTPWTLACCLGSLSAPATSKASPARPSANCCGTGIMANAIERYWRVKFSDRKPPSGPGDADSRPTGLPAVDARPAAAAPEREGARASRSC